jgi:hypothetical protein
MDKIRQGWLTSLFYASQAVVDEILVGFEDAVALTVCKPYFGTLCAC